MTCVAASSLAPPAEAVQADVQRHRLRPQLKAAARPVLPPRRHPAQAVVRERGVAFASTVGDISMMAVVRRKLRGLLRLIAKPYLA